MSGVGIEPQSALSWYNSPGNCQRFLVKFAFPDPHHIGLGCEIVQRVLIPVVGIDNRYLHLTVEPRVYYVFFLSGHGVLPPTLYSSRLQLDLLR